MTEINIDLFKIISENQEYIKIMFEKIISVGDIKLMEFIIDNHCMGVNYFLGYIEWYIRGLGKDTAFIEYIFEKFSNDKANDIACALIKKANEYKEFKLADGIKYAQAKKNLFNNKKLPALNNVLIEYINNELSSKTINFNNVKNILKLYKNNDNLISSLGALFIQKLYITDNKHKKIDCYAPNCMPIKNKIKFLLKAHDAEYDYKEILKIVVETLYDDSEKILDKIKKLDVVKNAIYLNDLSIELNKVNDIKKDFIAQIRIDDFFVIAIAGDISLMKLIIDAHKVNNLLIADTFNRLICLLPSNDINIDMSVIFLIKKFPEFINNNFIQKIENNNKKNIMKVIICKKLKNEDIEYIKQAMKKLLFIIEDAEVKEKLQPLQ